MLSPSGNWKPVSNNRSKKKSKQGCRTCKTRKVKCDEQRPVCGNCNIYYSSRIQKCDYGNAPNPESDEKPSNRSSIVRSTKGLMFDKHVIANPNTNTFMTLPRRRPLLPSTVGGAALDPFNTVARSDLPSADQLLHHYLSAIISKCLPAGHTPDKNPLIKGLWGLLQSDVFYHTVILQVSAVELELLQGKPNTFHSDKYTRESMRILRSRIEDPNEAVSDQTMSAVATLATLEYGKKNMTAMKMHLDGLKRMVSMRGGLSKVRASSQTTATMIHWFTMLMMQDSIFPPDKRDDLSSDEPSKLYSLEPSPQYLSLESFDMEEGVRVIMERTRRISEHLSSGVQSAANTPDDFHWQFNALLQRLCHLKVRAGAGSTTAYFTEACRHATSLFLFLPFDNHYPDPTLVINSMLHKLKSALQHLVPASGPQARLLLWLLAVGGVTSVNLPERDWFIGHLVPIVAHLELRSWADFTSAMEGIIYVRKFLDGSFRELWDDVKFATDALAEQDPYTSIILVSRSSSATLVESDGEALEAASTSREASQ
ncbi:uncharacterized protein LY89DRAFT_72922 [Mollisia scopiformis]|uniref:Zn(2)-C6 fungal-type domain-containing protein n=1 Tax=Mollisia scopiformis TaxID=149040 RepID=A0A194XAF5_MOLSC|nr:uncharacterized protein LY89DRAFT_72922 [Mollisia scopiformis]KUJ17158.1 hypothetical protein LY89DRAFT_72922 [Mollisia scopiformis]